MHTNLKRSKRISSGIKKEKGNGSASRDRSRIAESRAATLNIFLGSPKLLKGKWWTYQAILKGQNDVHGTIEIRIRHKNHTDARDFFPPTPRDIVHHSYLALLRNFNVTQTRAIETKRRKQK